MINAMAVGEQTAAIARKAPNFMINMQYDDLNRLKVCDYSLVILNAIYSFIFYPVDDFQFIAVKLCERRIRSCSHYAFGVSGGILHHQGEYCVVRLMNSK